MAGKGGVGRPGVRAEQLREVLSYEPETGRFYWRIRRKRVTVGAAAGTLHHLGYVHIHVLGHKYLAHRLAWLYVHGEWPSGQIDHINGDRADNRLVNLRVTTQRQNTQNQAVHRAGRLFGCCYHKPKKRWIAKIRIQGRMTFLGYYDTEQEAHEAYLRALATIGEQSND